jgi:flavorubredoxin
VRKRGVDILTALEAGTTKQSDEQQLAFAAAQGRAIYSFNMGDFCRLHSQWLSQKRSHAGIVVARQQHYSVGEQMRRLLRLVGRVSAEEMHNRLEFLSDWDEG